MGIEMLLIVLEVPDRDLSNQLLDDKLRASPVCCYIDVPPERFDSDDVIIAVIDKAGI